MRAVKKNPTSVYEVVLTDMYFHVTYKNPLTPTTPENLSFKNKPIQGGLDLFSLILLLNEVSGNKFIETSIREIPQTDPFLYNLNLLFAAISQISGFFVHFSIFIGLCSIIYYIYCYFLTSLKTFIDKKKILKWILSVVVLLNLMDILRRHVSAISYRIFEVLTIINSNHIQNFYYNPPGLAMGRSRVLHIESYSWPFKYLNKIVDLNPDYILTYILFIKYFYIFIIATYLYMLIAGFTTGIYSQDKFALSLPGGPATLNLITKCFYLKKPSKFIAITLTLITLMLILISYLLYVYINIYVKG